MIHFNSLYRIIKCRSTNSENEQTMTQKNKISFVIRIVKAAYFFLLTAAIFCILGLISLNGVSVRPILEKNLVISMDTINLYLTSAFLFFSTLCINARNIEHFLTK